MSFCLCNLLSRLPLIGITFWFNVYSIMKVFSFSSTDVERFSGLERDYAFNYCSPSERAKKGRNHCEPDASHLRKSHFPESVPSSKPQPKL